MIEQGKQYPEIPKDIAYSTKPRILQNIPELQRIINSKKSTQERLQYLRILRNHTDIGGLMKRQLFWLGGENFDSFEKILANPNYGHRTEKALYAYFISSIDRLNWLNKLSYAYEDMLYILKNLYMHVYLYTCNEDWNRELENYSEYMSLELNVLFNQQIRLLEKIGNEDIRVQEYVKEQLLMKNEYDRRIRDFNKKYIRDGLAILSQYSYMQKRIREGAIKCMVK